MLPATASYPTARYKMTSFLVDGDSMTQGIGASAASSLHTLLSAEPNFVGKGFFNTIGFGGRAVSQEITEFYKSSPFRSTNVFNYLFIWGGTAATSGTTFSELQTYWAQARAQGWKVIAFTILYQEADTPAEDALTDQINASIRLATSEWDYLVDVATIPELSDLSNTTYFADGTHLTALGYQTVADFINDTLALPVL